MGSFLKKKLYKLEEVFRSVCRCAETERRGLIFELSKGTADSCKLNSQDTLVSLALYRQSLICLKLQLVFVLMSI
jgi:hypothetical protein